ncbi:NRT2.5 [Symbiodinium sp. CCMP2592]|nr:NRT2.5 [Symbiodinium sp. CCMP2592]
MEPYVRRPAALAGNQVPLRNQVATQVLARKLSLFREETIVIPLCRAMEYKLAVDSSKKATELPLLRVCGTVQQNPHMRAFWASVISFFLAFLGWFALAPLGLEVATSMGTCENQLFPPTDFPTRPAYLKFKNLKSGLSYCQYGVLKEDGKEIECEDVPPDVASGAESTAEQKEKYRPQVLTKCVCTPGTECNSVIANAGVASVASTIFVRVALGTLLERFGPVNVQCGLLSFGAFWVAMAAAITAPWNYTLIRFFIGCAGATFVTNQFWCSLMFSPNVVGTANATAAGWGNLGGGVTQIFMMSVLFNPMVASGLEPNVAWRVCMVVPAVMFVVVAICMKLMCWDMPTARNYDPAVTGKTQKPSMWDYVEVLRDVRVVVMIFQYSACFGTELAMNNQLATHFRTYFQMDAGDASALAGAFGLMNLFARSLGGISSDVCFKYFGFRGRIWAQFLALFFEAIFLFSFGNVDNSQPWYVALAVLVCFSLFVQMAEGTSYGIVPFMNRKQLAVVSALVGAGGNLGAVIAGFCFYRPIEDALLPFQVHAGYVMFWALLSPCYYWSEMGGMFHGPAQSSEKGKTQSSENQSHTGRQREPAASHGWFALAPLGLEVATSMGTCENQLFPPTDFPTRPAYLKFKNLKSGLSYCQYGVLKEDGKEIECEDVPPDVASGAESTAEQKEKYRPQVLTKCVCTPGTECNSVIANAGVASVASTIFVRVALGTLLERFGPVNVQCGLLSFGAFWVAMAAAITAPWNYTLIRFFIGCAGATFVTNQFWCSLMFSPNVVGTANATAAGWGNLGGGVTQIFMMSVLFNPMVASGLEPNVAWRVCMVVPAVMFVVVAICMKLMCWDMPTARNYDPAVTGKTQKPSMWDYVEVLRDVRVVVMIFQYSACFGTELAMNNQLATHFRTYFQMDAGDASALAGAFGLMNLFARSLGGISSDVCFKYFGFRGRIWAQFLALFFEAIFLFSFGNVDNSQPWYVALAVLVCFSLFVQMAEGTSYGIVPFMNRKQLAVVSALVGAGGNLGAVIAGFCFYRPIEDALLPFQVHAGYVMFWALLSPCYYWSEMGGMFHGPAQSSEKGKTQSSENQSHTESVATSENCM